MAVLDRGIIGALLFFVLLLIGVQIARAAEIVPAIGLSKPVDGDQDAKTFGSLAIRGDLLGPVKAEIGASYRSETQSDGLLKRRIWPITASLWLSPVPMLYAGGGVGWYYTTFDYDQDRIPIPIDDETKQEFGVHLGGGLKIPLAPSVGIDLHGRYVMMREQTSRLVPEKFDPDFWSTSVGLAIKL
jgi:opacity protein-like surface antigen